MRATCCRASVAAKAEADCISPASIALVSSIHVSSTDGHTQAHTHTHTGENTEQVSAGDDAGAVKFKQV